MKSNTIKTLTVILNLEGDERFEVFDKGYRVKAATLLVDRVKVEFPYIDGYFGGGIEFRGNALKKDGKPGENRYEARRAWGHEDVPDAIRKALLSAAKGANTPVKLGVPGGTVDR